MSRYSYGEAGRRSPCPIRPSVYRQKRAAKAEAERDKKERAAKAEAERALKEDENA